MKRGRQKRTTLRTHSEATKRTDGEKWRKRSRFSNGPVKKLT